MTILYVIIGLMVFGLGYSIGKTSATEPLPKCCLDCLHLHDHKCMRFSGIYCDHYGVESRFERMTANRAVELSNSYNKGFGDGIRQGMEEERQANRFHRSLKGDFGFDEKMFSKELEIAIKPLNELKDRLAK